MGRVVEKQRMVKCSIGQSERKMERKVVMLMKCRYIRKQARQIQMAIFEDESKHKRIDCRSHEGPIS